MASSGGHWQQLMLLRDAYAHHKTLYVTTMGGLAERFDAIPSTRVPDCNRNQPFRLVLCILVTAWIILRSRPDVVISTGALPGVVAVGLGRLAGARTIWVDSLANAEEMSSSGRLARRFAHLWMSQWPEPAKAAGADFAGTLL